MTYVYVPLFIISFAIGIFCVYMTNPPKEVIYVYPTPDNSKQIQYKDRAGQCYEYIPQEVPCQKESMYPFQ
jgi:hypothetical protein